MLGDAAPWHVDDHRRALHAPAHFGELGGTQQQRKYHVRVRVGMMTCGMHPAEGFEPHHTSPFAFSGRIRAVTVRTDGAKPVPPEIEQQLYLHHQ